MGSGASTGAVGVPVNPRVKYSNNLEKKERKKVLVDAPVLVDIEHGSVRYRQSQQITVPSKSLKGKEHPFEKMPDDQLDKKDHYFYHARLNQYGPEASKEKEDQFKFYYVVKGPTSAQHKKIFYVYGQGWNAQDGMKTKPSETIGKGKDYAWSSSVKPNSLYYSLEFDDTDEQPTTGDENKLLEDLQSSPNKASVQMSLSSSETVAALKARLAIKMLKSVQDFHIAFSNHELRDEDVVGDLRPQQDNRDEELPENFAINLTLVN